MGRANPEIVDIDMKDISPNNYNPQEMPKDKFLGLVRHIRSVGFTDPIKIRAKDESDVATTPFVIVDGEHRMSAFLEAFPESKTIKCVKMVDENGQPLKKAEAIVSTIAYNFQHGEENPVKMAGAIKMAMNSGILLEDIEDLTGMKRNRLETYIEFDNLPNPNDELGGFGGGDSAGPIVNEKDPIIVSFAIYPEDKVLLDKAMGIKKLELPEEVDLDEERGRTLMLMVQMVLDEHEGLGDTVEKEIPEEAKEDEKKEDKKEVKKEDKKQLPGSKGAGGA